MYRKDRPVKSLICEEENISIFIDDRERYIIEVCEINQSFMQCIPVCEKLILFGEYPWTYHGLTDPKVAYCKDWKSVVNMLM